MISVIFPSRGRPEALEQCITSLRNRADDSRQVEILVAHDPDDKATGQVLGKTRANWPARGVPMPERFGYRRLHEYYNILAAAAAGDWLVIWNDDARIRTQGWDRIIEQEMREKQGLLRLEHVGGPPHCNPFPAVPASWIRCLGHVSLDPFVDTWLQQLGEALGLQRPVPVQLDHSELRDITWSEGRSVTPLADYVRDRLIFDWEADLDKLRKFLGL